MERQPYELASEEIKRQGQAPKELLKDVAYGAASLGTGAAAGGSVVKRIMPFLNKFIPQEMAIKGLSKISPQLGSFINHSLNQGHSQEDVFSFVKDKIAPEEAKSEPAKSNNQASPFDFLAKYSPKLAEFFRRQLQNGERPGIARLLAQQDFPSEIAQIEKENKRPFKEIINELFEGKAPIPPSQSAMAHEAMNPTGSQPATPPSAEAQAAAQSAQQPIGPGQQKLMDMLQKLNQKLGA